MEDKKVSQDLEEDEELALLRLAALATLKTRASKVSEPESTSVSKILPITSISRTADFSSDSNNLKSKQSWRTNSQPPKRKGKLFSKPSQRSNLIVITPVVSDKEKSREKLSTPQLLLPQHKWFQEHNEDSGSPKTDRRTGPTRFNRHASESESSDYDYGDSDDDSYSNETVLQDELSRNSTSNKDTEIAELNNGVCSEQRLNFENLDSDLSNDLKSENVPVHTFSEQTFTDHPLEDKESEETNLDLTEKPTENFVCDLVKNESATTNSLTIPESIQNDFPAVFYNSEKPKNKHVPIKFDLPTGKDNQRTKEVSDLRNKSRDLFQKPKDSRIDVETNHRSAESSENKASLLSKNDLRFELKRKKENPGRPVLSNRQNKHSDRLSPVKDRAHNRFRSQSCERNSSRERKTFKRSHSREHSRSPRRVRRRYNDDRSSSSHSRSSSPSSSSTVTSSDTDKRASRPISSVIQPVQSKVVVSDNQNSMKSSVTRRSYISIPDFDDIPFPAKKPKGIEINLKPLSNIKISIPGNDQRSNVSDAKKRGPVHMRLGTLPRKRIIQMPKEVEAAFVNTSSDDDNDNNCKFKNSNYLVLSKMCNVKGDELLNNQEKKLLQRSEVPIAKRGNVLR